MALVTTVAVTTVGGAEFTFTGDAGISAQRSIMNGQQIDAEGLPDGEQDPVRVIIPFESINHALTTITTETTPEVEDANCVVRTPAAEDGGDGGDDEGDGGQQ